MYWWDAGASVWRLTNQLYVSDGTAWREAAECWIWFDGWKRVFVQPGSLDSVTVVSPFADALSVGWTFSASDPSEWLMSFEYSFDFGSSWTFLFENDRAADDSDNPFTVSFDGVPGYVSLDDTYVRLSMRLGGTTHATNSPTTKFPPFPT
jgi:hypothetical protein